MYTHKYIYNKGSQKYSYSTSFFLKLVFITSFLRSFAFSKHFCWPWFFAWGGGPDLYS